MRGDTIMKNVRYIFVTMVMGLALSSCGDSFLTQYPEGGVLLQDQYEKLPDNLKGSIMGIYSKLYEYGGDHDTFGQRSIDMYGDIQSGDMAMKNSSYGWFESYERGYFYAYARSYIWSYYYDIINLANLGTLAVEEHAKDIFKAAVDEEENPSETIKLQGYYYGQLLAIRGWAYAGLLNYYCDPMDVLENDKEHEPAVPVYTETEIKIPNLLGARRSSVAEVYNRVYEDLTTAIDLLDYYSRFNDRGSKKLEVNADIARIILAYAMLNHGDKYDRKFNEETENAYDVALALSAQVINSGRYPILPKAKLTTTGFADIQSENWLWGQDVTVETSTALASFFGQVDIHSYSYAAAGDTKAIDSKLYDEIVATGWDARADWFNPGGVAFAYCPTRKFFNPGTKDITDLDKVDRNWLCDNIFMRVEEAYLIAAEAAWANGDESTAASYLKQLCDERVAEGKEAAYDAWVAGLSGENLKSALIYNWRVEMWGEGFGLQTLRRLSKTNKLGTNHLSRSEQDATVLQGKHIQFQCEIPTAETRYNPFIGTTQLTKNSKSKY